MIRPCTVNHRSPGCRLASISSMSMSVPSLELEFKSSLLMPEVNSLSLYLFSCLLRKKKPSTKRKLSCLNSSLRFAFVYTISCISISIASKKKIYNNQFSHFFFCSNKYTFFHVQTHVLWCGSSREAGSLSLNWHS